MTILYHNIVQQSLWYQLRLRHPKNRNGTSNSPPQIKDCSDNTITEGAGGGLRRTTRTLSQLFLSPPIIFQGVRLAQAPKEPRTGLKST